MKNSDKKIALLPRGINDLLEIKSFQESFLSQTLMDIFKLNGYEVNEISNDEDFTDGSTTALVTERALKQFNPSSTTTAEDEIAEGSPTTTVTVSIQPHRSSITTQVYVPADKPLIEAV